MEGIAAHGSRTSTTTSESGNSRLIERRPVRYQYIIEGPRHILVDTDVAARGLDIENVLFVINYDMQVTLTLTPNTRALTL